MKLGNKHFERFNITTVLEFLEFLCNQWLLITSIQSFMHTSLLWTRPQRERTKCENSISKLFQLNLYWDWMSVQCALLIVLTISAFTIHKLILIRNFELFIMLESRWLYDSSAQTSLNRKSKGIIWIIFDCHHSMEMLPGEEVNIVHITMPPMWLRINPKLFLHHTLTITSKSIAKTLTKSVRILKCSKLNQEMRLTVKDFFSSIDKIKTLKFKW